MNCFARQKVVLSRFCSYTHDTSQKLLDSGQDQALKTFNFLDLYNQTLIVDSLTLV